MVNTSSLLLTAVIVALLVGTKRLRHIGEDLGAAVKNFRKGLQTDESSNIPDEKK